MRKIDYFMSNPESIADAIDAYLNVTTDYFSCKTIGELVAGYLLMDNDSNTVVATDKEDDAVKCDLFKTVTKPENYHTLADTLDFGAFDEEVFDFGAPLENNLIEKYGNVISTDIIRYIAEYGVDSFGEITVPTLNDGVVYLVCDNYCGEEGYISNIIGNNNAFEDITDTRYEITFYDGGSIEAYCDSFSVIHKNNLPAYKYMYVMTVSPTSRNSFIKALSMYGFRVYAVDGIGYVFGYDTPTGYGVPTKQEVNEAFHNVLMYLEDNSNE